MPTRSKSPLGPLLSDPPPPGRVVSKSTARGWVYEENEPVPSSPIVADGKRSRSRTPTVPYSPEPAVAPPMKTQSAAKKRPSPTNKPVAVFREDSEEENFEGEEEEEEESEAELLDADEESDFDAESDDDRKKKRKKAPPRKKITPKKTPAKTGSGASLSDDEDELLGYTAHLPSPAASARKKRAAVVREEQRAAAALAKAEAEEEEEEREKARYPPLPKRAEVSCKELKALDQLLTEARSKESDDDEEVYELNNHFDVILYAVRAITETVEKVRGVQTTEIQGHMGMTVLDSSGICVASCGPFMESLQVVKEKLVGGAAAKVAVAKLEKLEAFITLVYGRAKTYDLARAHASNYYLDIVPSGNAVTPKLVTFTFKKKTPAQVAAEIEAARLAAIEQAKKDEEREKKRIEDETYRKREEERRVEQIALIREQYAARAGGRPVVKKKATKKSTAAKKASRLSYAKAFMGMQDYGDY